MCVVLFISWHFNAVLSILRLAVPLFSQSVSFFLLSVRSDARVCYLLFRYVKSPLLVPLYFHLLRSPDIMAILKATRNDEIEQRDLYDRPPALRKPWTDGKVALLGNLFRN